MCSLSPCFKIWSCRPKACGEDLARLCRSVALDHHAHSKVAKVSFIWIKMYLDL